MNQEERQALLDEIMENCQDVKESNRQLEESIERMDDIFKRMNNIISDNQKAIDKFNYGIKMLNVVPFRR